MKIVLQRVIKAKVTVDNKIIGEIGKGYLIFLGVGRQDAEETVKKYADKIVNLRIMNDENKKMNKSIIENRGEMLVVSQFTLYANTNEGRKPSFTEAAPADKAKTLYELFIQELKNRRVAKVEAGEFGAYMEVSLVNDGPVTIIL